MPITVEGLSYKYNIGLPTEERALEDISFTAEEGKITSILGHTGSGKSTLAQHLNGLILPQQGRVAVDGLEVRSGFGLREIRRAVGLVFQYPESQIFAETIEEELAFAPRNWGRSEDEIKKLVPEAMRMTGLDTSMLKSSPWNISGGQRRRVAIASVLAASPRYLVLDEPTAGLDSTAASGFISLLRGLAESGTGIVYITHDIETALAISDRILILEGGRRVSFERPADTAELLCRRRIKGLVLPELLDLALRLRTAGRISRLAWTPEDLSELLKEEKNGI